MSVEETSGKLNLDKLPIGDLVDIFSERPHHPEWVDEVRPFPSDMFGDRTKLVLILDDGNLRPAFKTKLEQLGVPVDQSDFVMSKLDNVFLNPMIDRRKILPPGRALTIGDFRKLSSQQLHEFDGARKGYIVTLLKKLFPTPVFNNPVSSDQA